MKHYRNVTGEQVRARAAAVVLAYSAATFHNPKRRLSVNPDGTAFCFYLDSRGRQHFNFDQRVWLHASVAMAVTPVMTIALETLAINLLTRVTRGRDHQAAVGVTSKRVAKLAQRFCIDCLLTARADGWVMPRSSLKAWLASQTQTARRSHRG